VATAPALSLAVALAGLSATVSLVANRLPDTPAQAHGGRIAGTVADRSGAMPGVTIRSHLRNRPAAADALATVTGAGGAFEFPNLEAGEYELSVTAPGSEATTERRVRVLDHQTSTVAIEVYRGCDTFADDTGAVSATDRNEAVRLGIEAAMQHEFADASQPPILSTANLPAGFDLDTVRPLFAEVLGADEIRRRARGDVPLWLFAVDDVRVRGGCVAVAVVHRLERNAEAAPGVLLGGAAVMNEFRRAPAGWTKKRVYFRES
jgi:hypothetical protein